MTLARRAWRVTVGELRVGAPMRVAFDVERTLSPQPNKARIRIWNLTASHRDQLEQLVRGQVIVEAGYEQDRGLEQLFVGELERARAERGHGFHAIARRSDREGADVVTHVDATDGGRAFRESRIEQSFEPGVTVGTVLRACARAMGVGPGNVEEVARVAELERGGASFPEGTVLSGPAHRELTRLLQSLGYRWSVQHGVLQVLRRGEALQAQAVRLTPSTGLVGSPERGSGGRVRIRALLTPDLWPGRHVVLQSERIEGTYQVRTVHYEGDSHGDAWYATCELAPEGTAP